MKLKNYLLLGAAALALASCSHDDVAPSGADKGFALTVNLPGDLGTRAFGDGYTADDLYVAVYDADNNYKYLVTEKTSFKGSLTTTVYFDLPNGKNYLFSCFAANENAASDTDSSAAYYFNPAEKGLIVHYNAMLNADNLADDYDCFFNFKESGLISSSNKGMSITLYRPVCQINWGTADFNLMTEHENAYGPKGELIETSFTAEKVYNSLNIVTGRVNPGSYQGIVTLAKGTVPTGETFPVEGYDYVAMQYLLAPKDVWTYDVNLTITNTNGDGLGDLKVDVPVLSVPVQANYRTNIYGNLLTNPYDVTVVKHPAWSETDFDIVYKDQDMD